MATADRAQAVLEQRRAGLTGQTVPAGAAPLTARLADVEPPCPRPDLPTAPPGAAAAGTGAGAGCAGPALLPGPLSPAGVPAARSPKAAFDAIVLTVVQELESRWHAELGLVEFAVEETPMVPDDWDADTVPLASLVRGTGGAPTRLVLFRRPIELRADDPRRPVRDGAHGARRAGLRAARAAARGGRPALRRGRRRLTAAGRSSGRTAAGQAGHRGRCWRSGSGVSGTVATHPRAGVGDRAVPTVPGRAGLTTTYAAPRPGDQPAVVAGRERQRGAVDPPAARVVRRDARPARPWRRRVSCTVARAPRHDGRGRRPGQRRHRGRRRGRRRRGPQ